jgi:CheY-like chemotaxis protein
MRMNDSARILIMDDDPDMLHAISRILTASGLLSQLGYIVLEAANGDEALRVAQE